MDDKKYQNMMGANLDRQLYNEWSQKYSPQAMNHFMRPANVCELCGKYMHQDPRNGREKEISEWERKWSVHEICRDQAAKQLDNATNISSKR